MWNVRQNILVISLSASLTASEFSVQNGSELTLAFCTLKDGAERKEGLGEHCGWKQVSEKTSGFLFICRRVKLLELFSGYQLLGEQSM
jgi:hypothetical protein